MKNSVLSFSILIFLTLFATPVFAADTVYFYHTDPAGTPLSMTDSSGTVVWKADYKPFGEENSTSGAAENDLRFVGKEKDEETGLSYFGARYEDAKAGRFIAPDPVRAVDEKTNKTNERLLLNPQRLNTYAYALNNPYRYVDPDGHHPILIGLGIIWLGEMVMPQTMGSSISDSFIARYWSDILLLPSGIGREGAQFAVKGLSNAEVRSWYSTQVKAIDTSGPLIRATAERVHNARNALKQFARDMMADRAAARQLAREQPLRPFEYYVDKYSSQGYTGEALWKRIIDGSTTPNASVNKRFGVH